MTQQGVESQARISNPSQPRLAPNYRPRKHIRFDLPWKHGRSGIELVTCDSQIRRSIKALMHMSLLLNTIRLRYCCACVNLCQRKVCARQYGRPICKRRNSMFTLSEINSSACYLNADPAHNICNFFHRQLTSTNHQVIILAQ